MSLAVNTRARHDGMRRDGDRRGADDSDRHIEMPGRAAVAAQLDQDPIVHVPRPGATHRLHRPAAALQLQVGFDRDRPASAAGR